MDKDKNNKGFTLGELLIVVGIIAVLVVISIPIFNNQLEKARDAASIANIRSAYAETIMAYTDMSERGVNYTKIDGHFYWVNTANKYSDGSIGNIYSEPYVVIESKKENKWSGLGDNIPFEWVNSEKCDFGKPGKYRIDIFFKPDGSISYGQIYR